MFLTGSKYLQNEGFYSCPREEVKKQSARVLDVLMGDKLSGTIQEGAGITWFVTMLLPVVE